MNNGVLEEEHVIHLLITFTQVTLAVKKNSWSMQATDLPNVLDMLLVAWWASLLLNLIVAFIMIKN